MLLQVDSSFRRPPSQYFCVLLEQQMEIDGLRQRIEQMEVNG